LKISDSAARNHNHSRQTAHDEASRHRDSSPFLELSARSVSCASVADRSRLPNSTRNLL
jgi:hypothetical protein